MSASGLSTTRLGRLRKVMAGSVDRGEVAGVVALVGRRGEAHVEAIGASDLATGQPMRRDTLFRVASMTKPITAVAAMILVEEAKLRLDDPVDGWLPELANRKVLRRSMVRSTTPCRPTGRSHCATCSPSAWASER